MYTTQPVTIELLNTGTDDVRMIHVELPIPVYGTPWFDWEHGEYSCDCNRRLLFNRLVDPEYDDDEECTEGNYLAKVIDATGNTLYSEF